MDWLLEQLHNWGYYALFFLTFLETAVFLGLLIPGETAVIVAGLLASQGVLGLAQVIWISTLGGIAGDAVGYYIGRRYGETFVLKHGRRFFIKKEYFYDTRDYFMKYGGKTVFIARNIGWLRPFAPLVAGTTRFPYYKFLFFNVYGCLVWAAQSALLGYFAGSSWKFIKNYMGAVAGFFALFVVIIVFLYFFLKKRKRFIEQQLATLDRKIDEAAPGPWRFAKDRFRVRTWYGLNLTIAIMLISLALVAFAGIVNDLLEQDALHYFDRKALDWVNRFFAAPFVEQLMRMANWMAPYVVALVAVGILIFLLVAKDWWRLLNYVVAIGLGEALIVMLTLLFKEWEALDAHFPSVISFNSMIVFGFLAVVAWTNLKNEILRFLIYSLSLSSILFVGFSQVALGVHWLSDVLAAYAVAFAWLVISIILSNTLRHCFGER